VSGLLLCGGTGDLGGRIATPRARSRGPAGLTYGASITRTGSPATHAATSSTASP
jgi:hypothetical protein